MTSTDFTRTVQGQHAPVPGTYTIDPAHTSVTFQVRHMGLSKVRGGFTDIAGTITVGETPADSSVEATLQASSIDTAQPQRDDHVRGSEFLDVQNYPTMEFRSTGIDRDGEALRIHGDLTIRGTTHPVTLDAEFDGAGPDVLGNPDQPRIGFSAATTINRDDFGLTWNMLLDSGSWAVGKQVRVELDIEAVRQ